MQLQIPNRPYRLERHLVPSPLPPLPGRVHRPRLNVQLQRRAGGLHAADLFSGGGHEGGGGGARLLAAAVGGGGGR